MEGFAADLDGLVEGTEAERAQRVAEGPGVADAEVEPTQVWPQSEVITLDVEQRRGLHTARALCRAGGKPAPVGQSPLAGGQRMTRGAPATQLADDWVGSLERGRDAPPLLRDDRTPTTPGSGRGPNGPRQDEGATTRPTQRRPRVSRIGATTLGRASASLPAPTLSTLKAWAVADIASDERVVDEEQEVRGESVEVTCARCRVSFWRWRHAAERSRRNRSGSRARSRAETAACTASWSRNPSDVSSTSLSALSLSIVLSASWHAMASRTPLVTRRGTDAASRSRRPSSSRPARNAVASAATTCGPTSSIGMWATSASAASRSGQRWP